MPKPYPIELRTRVVEHVGEGHSHRSTAVHFRVSIKFVNDMVKLKRETGQLAAKTNPGRLGRGKLAPYKDWIGKRVCEKPDITLAQLCLELKQQFGLQVNRWPVSLVLHGLGLSHKKRHFLARNNSVVMSGKSVISGAKTV